MTTPAAPRLAAPILLAREAERDWRRAHAVPPPHRDLAGFREAMRELSDDLARRFTLPAPPQVRIDDAATSAGRRVRVYRPDGAAGPWPTQIVLHGGGFVMGAVDEEINDRLCAGRAASTGCQLLALDYRLAPRHSYPAAVRDTITLVDDVLRDPRGWAADPERLGLAGVSAGGGVAAAAALWLRDRSRAGGGPGPLRHLLLEVPAVSLRAHGGSFAAYGSLLAGPPIRLLAFLYAGWRLARPGYASPLHVGDLSGLPPTAVLTAEYDPLRDAGEDFARRLAETGVPVQSWRGAGHVHASGGLTAVWEAARLWQDTAAELTRRALA